MGAVEDGEQFELLGTIVGALVCRGDTIDLVVGRDDAMNVTSLATPPTGSRNFLWLTSRRFAFLSLRNSGPSCAPEALLLCHQGDGVFSCTTFLGSTQLLVEFDGADTLAKTSTE